MMLVTLGWSLRGVWVDNALLIPGQLVALLSSPVESETEGPFVRVQLESGDEGWVKLKNVRLPCAQV